MKKLPALLLIAALMLPLCALAVSADTPVTYNLVSSDNTWTKVTCTYETQSVDVEYSYDGDKLTTSTTSLWPSMTAVFDSPLPVKASDATIDFDITVTSGSTNVNIVLTNGDVITLHHFIGDTADANMYDQGSGDLKASGAKTGIKFSDLKANLGVLNFTDLTAPDEDGYYYIKEITVFAVYGSNTINKLTVTTTVPDSAPVEESKDDTNPDTGDATVVLFAVLGSVALAGSFIAVRKASR